MPDFSPGSWNSPRRSALRRRSTRLAGAALLAALLAACGGSSGGSSPDDSGGGNGGEAVVDNLAAFKQQTLIWQACDAAAIDEDLKYELAQLGERARCALMRVPRDYADPSAAELRIEVLKVAAQQTAQKRETIVLNPGGPGEDGLSLALWLHEKLTPSQDSDAQARLQEMSHRFDLVSFSPRGTGKRSLLECELPETLPIPDSFHFDDGDDNAAKFQQGAQRLAQACAAHPLSAHIHTEATARDMDLLRGLLGEEKLNYIGYSYGAWLGAWYAGLFPEHTGRMLFDSSLDITAGADEFALAPIAAEQRIIDELLLPHAAANPARFGLGDDAQALGQRLGALPAALKTALALTLDISERDHLERNIFTIAAALGLQQVLAKDPAAGFAEISAEIDALPAFADTRVAGGARALVPRLFFPHKPIGPLPHLFSQWSVQCNDSGTALTAPQWVEATRNFVQRYPLIDADLVFNPCLYWHAPARKGPPLAKIAEAGQMLMLQSEYDGLTPVGGARKTFAALRNAHLVVVEKEYQHGVFPYGTACVDNLVASYFLDGPLSAGWSICAGKAFVADEDNEDDQDDEDDEA